MNSYTATLKRTQFYPILIISLCSAFLFYKYILQIFPSIITEQLMQEFQLNGTGLGNLAGTFYYSYMVTQLFVGFLLDKYSCRWLTSISIFSCALGIFLFAQCHSMWSACLARSLMGVGVAFATVSYMKMAAVWFPPRQYAFVSGLLASAAMAGAVFGQAPMAYIVGEFGWRYSLSIVGLVGIALAIVFLTLVRDNPSSLSSSPVEKSSLKLKDFLTVFKNKQNWLLTLYGGLAFSPIAVFGGLWGNPFLEQAYALTKTESASAISLVFIGLGVGSPLLGFLSDYLNNRKHVMLGSTLVSCVAITAVLYCHPLPTLILSALLFTFGFGLGAFMLVFAIGKEINSLLLTASVIAMINTSDAILDGVTEPFIGRLLDYFWDGTLKNGVHLFSLHSYHLALSVLPIYLLTACVLLFWLKEKKKD